MNRTMTLCAAPVAAAWPVATEFINLTPGKRAIRLEGVPAKTMLEQQRVTAKTTANAIPPWIQSKSKSGRWECMLAPFEVCQVRVTPTIN